MKREIVIEKKKDGMLPAIHTIVELVTIWLRTIGNGTWVLKLERKANQRTLSQNALMWVWFEILAKEFTEATDKYYSRETVKYFFCCKYLPLRLPNGEIVGGSTSGLTTEQMSEFMDKVQAYAGSEWGIELLNQEDEMFNQWRNQYE